MEERGRGLTTIKRRMERDGLWVMEESEADEKNEGGVDKALCAKRKLCESETPSDQLVFPLQLLFFFFVPVLKVVLKTSVAKKKRHHSNTLHSQIFEMLEYL